MRRIHRYHRFFLKLVMVIGICLVGHWPVGSMPVGEVSAAEVLEAPEVLVHQDLGTSDHPGMSFAVIVDKSRQELNLYRYDGYWQLIQQWPCSTGKLMGPKKVEGDMRTPEGVYFATRDVGRRFLTATYGDRALPLDYPNWLDKFQSRTGSAIWLHGTNKPLQDRDSNGCVVLRNADINLLAQYIRLNRTPVIIVDRLRQCPVKAAAQTADIILSTLEQWHTAMMYGGYDEFCQWYGSGMTPSMQWWRKWWRKRKNQGNDRSYESLIGQRAVYKFGDYYVVLFNQYLKMASMTQWVGRRKLYLSLVGSEVRIVGDTFQTVPYKRRDPLFFAWQKLLKRQSGNTKSTAGEDSGQDTRTIFFQPGRVAPSNGAG